MKNIFEEEKKFFKVEHFFFLENWVYFGQGEDFKLTTELSEKKAIFPQTGNQKRLK